ncbi:MAG: NADH:ubiquinone oxidoreductase 24 kD subunit [Herbinix sp.]|jgi:NADH:ubiquinone oxidoreductase subunit E|nr:NADH:ubiquinone oxidoreductase 24 kD subunit [Herbinix sp.]
MNIYICVGSSCHLKGSYDIIQLMREAISNNKLEDKVKLSAAFCLGRCTDGVSVKINDDIVCGVSRDNFNQFFRDNVLSQTKLTS